MTDPVASPAKHSSGRVGLVIAVIVVAVAALGVYLQYGRAPEPKHLKLALLTWTEDPFWEPLIAGAKEYAEKSNVDLVVIRSKPTVEAQTQHIRELLDGGIDGLAISPNDPKAQAAILAEATNKVPVVFFDSDSPETARRRFIGIDNYAAGRFAADEIREAMPEGGPILITVGSATMQHGRDRRQGLIDGLLERGFDRNRTPDPLDVPLKGPKYTIVATVTDGADPAKAVVTIADALKAHPEVKGVVGLFSYSAPAALEAAKQVGRDGQLKVVGFDESDQTQAAIEAGTIHSSILQDSHRCGFETIEVLADELRGVPRGPAEQSPILPIGINVLTSKNIAELRTSGVIRQPAGGAVPGAPGTQPS